MTATPSDLDEFIADPVEYFEWSLTRLWTMPEQDQRTYQLAGLKRRFGQLRDAIPFVKKIADRDGIDTVDGLEDIAPLLLDHTVYKSYPTSLLENGRFAMINRWLEKLSTEKLSHVDVSACDSIDSWLDVMDAQTRLKIHNSSGTSGTVSLFPKAKKEIDFFGKQYPMRFQTFGEPRPNDVQPKAHVIVPSYRAGGSAHFRINDEYFRRIAHSDEAYMHVAFPGRMSADILYLAGRIRAAKARGELDRIEIQPNLLARLDEFETSAGHRGELMHAFLEDITGRLAGERVFMACAPTYLWPLTEKGLAAGKRGVFSSDSVISSGGGAKGMVLPNDWKEKVKLFTGVSNIPVNYGMTEMTSTNMLCEHNHYHISPWIIPFVLDPETSKPLPRNGTVTGRFAFFDLVPDTHWGGFISGDEVTMHWSGGCTCGRAGPFLGGKIGRFSESRGGDDKISCAASAEAHEEAMDFLAQLHTSEPVS